MLKNLLDNNGFNGLVKGRYGYMLYNKNDTYIGKAIEKYGEFSELEATLFKQICRPGNIVLDIGANIGSHTLALSQFVGDTGQVYAFEPQPVVYQTLCANMAINSVVNAQCHCLALSDEKGDIFIPNINYAANSNYGAVEIEKFKEGQRIPKVPLDDVLKAKKVDFIKIDVEGMEQQVIRGANRIIHQHQPIIYMENDRLQHSKALIELMWSLGYTLYWHLPPLFNPNNFAGDSEAMHPGIISVNLLCIPKTKPAKLNGFNEVVDSDEHPLGNRG